MVIMVLPQIVHYYFIIDFDEQRLLIIKALCNKLIF